MTTIFAALIVSLFSAMAATDAGAGSGSTATDGLGCAKKCDGWVVSVPRLPNPRADSTAEPPFDPGDIEKMKGFVDCLNHLGGCLYSIEIHGTLTECNGTGSRLEGKESIWVSAAVAGLVKRQLEALGASAQMQVVGDGCAKACKIGAECNFPKAQAIIRFVNPKARKGASKWSFDGFGLGDPLLAAVAQTPYSRPCDNDGIDHNARRFWVYGALPCRDISFPEETTLMLYAGYAEDEATAFMKPIEAIAWLYGTWLNSRSSFPLRPGMTLADAKKLFGEEKTTFKITRKRATLDVYLFADEVHVITLADKIIGFVVGSMPEDPSSEQWNGLMEMYERYTPGPHQKK